MTAKLGGPALLWLMLAAACSTPDEFVCANDNQCGEKGVCRNERCALPDTTCASGLRYVDQSGSLSNECVPVDPGQATSTQGETNGASETTATGNATTFAADAGNATTTGAGSDTTATPPAGDVVFLDENATEFAAGQHDMTEWVGGNLRLLPNENIGTFVSRVFDAAAPASWEDLAWDARSPYGKPLPNNAALEAGYVTGGIDMADNVLLLHVDGDGPLSQGDVVPDSSGRSNDGVFVAEGGEIAALQAGVFGDALSDVAATRISVATGVGSDLEFGETDFTWAIWVNTTDACESNRVYMGVDNSDQAGDEWPHLWLGCTTSQWAECPGEVTTPRAAGLFRSGDPAENGAFFCGSTNVNDGAWHHLTVVKAGHAATVDVTPRVRLYVDGLLEADSIANFLKPFEYPAEPDFAIGAFSRGSFPAELSLDEVAIWRRALTDAEVADVYRRGTHRLGLTLRLCATPDCSDAPPFVGGADMTQGEQFTEPTNALGPFSPVMLQALAPSQWIQYRVEFDRSLHLGVPGAELGLSRVRLSGSY